MSKYVASPNYSCYTNTETGETYLTIFELARLSGVEVDAVSFWAFATLGNTTTVEVPTATGLKRSPLIPNSEALSFILDQAKKGNETAERTMSALFQAGFTVHALKETGLY